MNDTLTVKKVAYDQEAIVAASGSSTSTPRSVAQLPDIIGNEVLGGASVAPWLTVSPVTAVPDPWLIEDQRRSSASAANVVDGVRRRPITLREALKLADEIMRKAEEGRIRAAEEEANRLFDLENVL